MQKKGFPNGISILVIHKQEFLKKAIEFTVDVFFCFILDFIIQTTPGVEQIDAIVKMLEKCDVIMSSDFVQQYNIYEFALFILDASGEVLTLCNIG